MTDWLLLSNCTIPCECVPAWEMWHDVPAVVLWAERWLSLLFIFVGVFLRWDSECMFGLSRCTLRVSIASFLNNYPNNISNQYELWGFAECNFVDLYTSARVSCSREHLFLLLDSLHPSGTAAGPSQFRAYVTCAVLVTHSLACQTSVYW
jgi:hypothetical protein